MAATERVTGSRHGRRLALARSKFVNPTMPAQSKILMPPLNVTRKMPRFPNLGMSRTADETGRTGSTPPGWRAWSRFCGSARNRSVLPEVKDIIAAFARRPGEEQREISDQEILERLL